MDTPGNVLKTAREDQKKSLREIAKKLKINIEYLKAIENDNYALLPAEIFTKAYLRSFAEALGVESGYVLRLYDNQLNDDQSEEDTVPEPAPVERQKMVFQYKPFLIVAVLAVIVLSFVLFSKKTVQQPVNESVQEIETNDAIAAVEKPEVMTLTITATEITWVSVRVDDGKPNERLLRSGETVSVTAVEKFAVKIGNAGGTKLALNNEDLGELGPHGKVIDIVLP